jgi:hypothetical protein
MFLSTGLLIILLIIILFMFGIITITFSDNGKVINNKNPENNNSENLIYKNKNNMVEGFNAPLSGGEIAAIILGTISIICYIIINFNLFEPK